MSNIKYINKEEAIKIAKQKWGDKVVAVGTRSEVINIRKEFKNEKDYKDVKLGYVGGILRDKNDKVVDLGYSFEKSGLTVYVLLNDPNSSYIIIPD